MSVQAIASPIALTHTPAVLTVVVPTFNEKANVTEIFARLDHVLADIAWEVIFVDDDSPDHTAETVKAIAGRDSRVRCLKRVGRRGLAGACIEGMLASSARYVAVMDADLQHDESILPQMLSALMENAADLVVGSRYVAGGSATSFTAERAKFSRAATGVARRLLGVEIADPMSGFFMLKREKLDEVAGELSPVGFKILLDIVLTARRKLRVIEIPYEFRPRRFGESKFDAAIGLEFVGLALAKITGGAIGPRFISFSLVGTTGLAVHLVVLRFALAAMTRNFALAQAVATFVSMLSNFLLNNQLTYHDRRLSGQNLITGFFGFCLIGSVGALTNVGLASWIYAERPTWWLAGAAGAIMGALWNYSMSSQFVWRAR
ncbi:MAG TPA: glycosyltransferase family 2 protein [Rhizomicrobium sp.]|jgi:dolichol-phosphate mannosyltransferase|nr:glycosyltransferase family 2 protein [Rhizomicrobium sp.]